MGERMTKERLIKILLDECGGDFEIAHGNADDALLAYIGDPEITEAYKSQVRYCA